MNTALIPNLLAEDAWFIRQPVTQFLSQLHTLESPLLQLSANGITVSREVDCPELVEVDQRVSIPEAGFTLLPSKQMQVLMYNGHKNHKDISLEVSHPDNPEALFINFDLTAKNTHFFTKLTQAVHSTRPLTSLNHLDTKLSPTCPCCAEKQREIRENISLHPLYPLLTSPEFPSECMVLHAGAHTHSLQLFKVSSNTSHRGVLHLHGPQQHLSIDLTQIYNLRAHIEEIHKVEYSSLTGYNSRGQIILEIRQEGPSAFHLWGKTLKQGDQSQIKG